MVCRRLCKPPGAVLSSVGAGGATVSSLAAAVGASSCSAEASMDMRISVLMVVTIELASSTTLVLNLGSRKQATDRVLSPSLEYLSCRSSHLLHQLTVAILFFQNGPPSQGIWKHTEWL
ncbi:hypothetical protein AAFF_G00385570 [Aldrovandia affinis]|uniref:Uncharacterized protein n=1 Tax=Aldrovandia affinis TaxID=143900 RepID=A0AAD7SEY7_9TELE|nr:hypothetical protein AAFF_G00385570 [Aldrovandia affinis]